MQNRKKIDEELVSFEDKKKEKKEWVDDIERDGFFTSEDVQAKNMKKKMVDKRGNVIN